jgi:hypothetical protein
LNAEFLLSMSLPDSSPCETEAMICARLSFPVDVEVRVDRNYKLCALSARGNVAVILPRTAMNSRRLMLAIRDLILEQN